jgi:hypothetical protein
MVPRQGLAYIAAVKYFKCSCEHCGGRIEYPAQSVGLSYPCPHCGKETDLTLPPPPDAEPSGSRKHLVWLIVGGLILLLGGIGIAIAFVMLNNMAHRRGPR